MIKVPESLTNDEMNALRSIAALDGRARVPLPIRARLEFYGLIEETAHGWRPTRTGRERLDAAAREAAA